MCSETPFIFDKTNYLMSLIFQLCMNKKVGSISSLEHENILKLKSVLPSFDVYLLLMVWIYLFVCLCGVQRHISTKRLLVPRIGEDKLVNEGYSH